MLKRLSLALAAVVLALPSPAAAQRSTVVAYNFAANYVIVIRDAMDPQAQVDTSIFIFAFSPRAHPSDAAPTVVSEVGYSIVIRNVVTRAVYYVDVGYASDFELEMLPGLQSAALRATVATRLGDTANIDLHWDAAGSRESTTLGPNRLVFDGGFSFGRADFTERTALASGSVYSRAAAAAFRDASYARLGTTHQVSVEKFPPDPAKAKP